jgi:hypothetical protein
VISERSLEQEYELSDLLLVSAVLAHFFILNTR